MDPISNVDRLVLLLRQRLAQRSGSAGAAGSKARAEADTPQSGLDVVQALAALEDVDERQLRRALIQGVLGDQFGRELLNEARFQQVVDRVTEAMEDDAECAALLSRVAGELRASAR